MHRSEKWCIYFVYAGTSNYEKMAIVPTKSALDEREYRFVTLPNQLKCLLISDPTTDKVPRSAVVMQSWLRAQIQSVLRTE